MELVKSLAEAASIPTDVQNAYSIDINQAEKLGGGCVNRTYGTSIGGREIILQQLGPIFEPGVVDDFIMVTDHLGKKGWPVPTIIPSNNGSASYEDGNGALWRAMTRIDADTVSLIPPSNETFCRAVGGMVARFHIDMSELENKPSFQIPHFHDIDHHAQKLAHRLDSLSSEQQHVAEELLKRYGMGLRLPAGASQIIHGDPKLANMLFKDGMPYTLIDFDTVMHANTWLDIGDLLRSYISRPNVFEQSLDSVIEGYYCEAAPATDIHFFKRAALRARKVLTMELGMRHLNDIVDNEYFDWDSSEYESRAGYNWARAQVQWDRLRDTEKT